jgi:predicted RNase H-like HicB family nuclease
MNSTLWEQAEKLAARSYSITIEEDTLFDEQKVFVARHLELPGCKAQGNSPEEAKNNLDEARVDYIYTLLDAGLDIPLPDESLSSTSNQSMGNAHIWVFDASTNEAQTNAISSSATQTTQATNKSSVSLEGDLLKQG